ncbi:unnamed protein product, partial [marine sediment metagenome]
EKAWVGLGEPTVSKEKNIKIGRGIAIGQMSYGRMTFLRDSSRCYVKLETDGSLIVRSGIPDLGGGQASLLSQIAANEMGVPMEKVRVYNTDSMLTPLAGTTTATRQTYMSGNAALKAARALAKILLVNTILVFIFTLGIL